MTKKVRIGASSEIDGSLPLWVNLSEDDIATIVTGLALYNNMLAVKPELLTEAMDDALQNASGSGMASGHRDRGSVDELVDRLVEWRRRCRQRRVVVVQESNRGLPQ